MYSITLRETGDAVEIRPQPEFKQQVEMNCKVRAMIGDKASGVLMVRVFTAKNELICVDSKALVVRYYHSKDKERVAMFAEAELLLHAKRYDEAEEMLWLAVTKVSLVDSGVVDENGNLKLYSSFSKGNRRERPLAAEEVDTDDCFIS